MSGWLTTLMESEDQRREDAAGGKRPTRNGHDHGQDGQRQRP